MQIINPPMSTEETIIEQQEEIQEQRGIIANLRKGIDETLPTRKFIIAEKEGYFYISRISWLHPIVGPKTFEFNNNNEAEFLLVHLLQNDKLRAKAMGYLGMSELTDEELGKSVMKFLLEQKHLRKMAKDILSNKHGSI